MWDNMIVNLSGHTGKAAGIDIHIEHLIKADKVCVHALKQYVKLITDSSRVTSPLVGYMQTGIILGTSLRSATFYPTLRSTAAVNLNHDTLDPPTHALIAAVTCGSLLKRLVINS